MKLGELFVDLGVNSGSAFNTLSNFAFQFNNIATTAEKVTKGLEKAFSPALKTAPLTHNIQNLAKFLGESEKSIQGIKNAAGEMGISWDSMTEKLKKFSEERMSYFLNPKSAFYQKQAIFGLTDKDLRGSPIAVMGKIIDVISRVENEATRNQFASVSGFSQDELTAWSNFFNNRKLYEENPWNFAVEELEQGNELYMNLNRFSKNLGHVSDQLGKNLTPTLNKLLDGINNFLETESFRKFVKHPVDETKKFIDEIKPDLLKKYDELDWKTKLALSPLTALIPYGQAYTTGSLLGEGATTGALALLGNKTTQNPEFAKSVAYSFYRSKGFSDSAAKAWVGNLLGESSLNPSAVGDNGASFGIAQWRGSRRKALEEFARKRGTSVDDLMTQLEFTLSEIGESHRVTPERLNKLSMKGATGVLVNEYERSANQSADIEKRYNFARGLGDLESRIARGVNNNINIQKDTTIYTTPEKVEGVADKAINGEDQIASQFDLGGMW